MKFDKETGFNFDTDDDKPAEMPVRYRGKQYVIREASGAAAAAYRNCVFKSTKLGPDGKPERIEGLGDAEAVLVQGCLFEVLDRKEGGDPVTGVVALGFVKGMPNRVLKPLFDWVQEVSGLKEQPQTVDDINKHVGELLARRDEIIRGETAPKGVPGEMPDGST